MIKLCCENLSPRCVWLYVIYMSCLSFRVNPHLEWITIRTLKHVRDIIMTCSINWSCGNIFVCYLKTSTFHSSRSIKILLEKTKIIHIFLLRSTNIVQRTINLFWLWFFFLQENNFAVIFLFSNMLPTRDRCFSLSLGLNIIVHFCVICY